ncbi:MAG TPA: c-type cytochrome biogenesis protein CcmI [Nitrosomonas europaea]|uniref:TPR repeat n=1 Tax=Nitrosomonas europaea (strain ATCC 19718 / CIP 103999 / KCTC 2705 / NBRC 14298) TaxID=228410 RepID=Q82WC1_NITEU|nr:MULTISPECIES: c-type cytochrome biogenesis protein CcmI [Nitrosomonas]CAD84682.1 TPR repeat [Nitrosomonas europaea ATCC 19718]SDW32549.1 cytochrome c-type biogenesis protein CcmH [Nitrosomonas europaea]SDW60093.1 cytochrome c-type biogenesis protein CcmH [Nitrosomonas europaea]SES91425.1 cytochrome c-type biogenesis protein CcmH [Nitrosomonas europaea]SJZ42265.1 cytochrome c-type biogenesis protein CcmH [Nitrosomonas europaea]
MTAFWVVAGIFIVVALLFVIPVLLRSKRNESQEQIERQAANITIYRDQLAELERDLRNDTLSREQYDSSKQELQKRMLQDVSENGESVTHLVPTSRHGVVAGIIVTLVIPLAAIYLYLVIGDTRGLLPQSQLANATQFSQNGAGGEEGHIDISSMVESLAARLRENPEDIEGWVMLGRSYAIMERFDDASATYAKLVQMVPDNPQFLSDYADMLAMINNGSLLGKPAEMITRALAIDPNFPKALALAGTLEFEQDKFDQAVAYWERLLSAIPADSRLHKSVSDSIVQAKSLAMRSKGESAPVQLAQNSNVGTDATAGSSSAEKQEISAGVPSISGSVTLDPSLADKVSPDDTLFVFARASQGPKMPLAILRLNARDIPVSFKLDDNMAMTPAMKLSSFPEVVVGARISKTGQAIPASGDLEGHSDPVKIGDGEVSITIDHVVP